MDDETGGFEVPEEFIEELRKGKTIVGFDIWPLIQKAMRRSSRPKHIDDMTEREFKEAVEGVRHGNKSKDPLDYTPEEVQRMLDILYEIEEQTSKYFIGTPPGDTRHDAYTNMWDLLSKIHARVMILLDFELK